MPTLRIPTAPVFRPLLEPARYKGAHGGRGSGKSHFFGELMVEECLRTPGTLAVCIREVQKSLMQSSKRMIESKIQDLGVGAQFKILHDRIITPGDGLIIFQGMQDATAESIKSLREKVDQHNTGNPVYERIERVIVERAPPSAPESIPDESIYDEPSTEVAREMPRRHWSA